MRDPRGGYTSSKRAGLGYKPHPTSDLYEGYLAELGVTSFGRAWNLADPKERRECAEWLASIHAAATKDGPPKQPPPAWRD